MYGCPCYGQEDGAEALLQTNHATRGAEESEYGGHDQKVGRRRGIEAGSQWNVAEESIEETEIGEVEG